MGRPKVHLQELIGLDGLTVDEIRTFLPPGEQDSDLEILYPVNLTWAMGFAWSSFVAQSVMTGCCLQTGLLASAFLADGQQIPGDMRTVVGVATDDIMHFSDVGPEVGANWMASLEGVFSQVGVLTNQNKDIVGALNGTCVGIDLTHGVFLSPSSQRLWSYLQASADLFSEPVCTPLELASYTGTVQWLDLLNRWLLSCLDKTHAFNRESPLSSLQQVPSDVQSELMLNAALSPYWEADLRRPWLEQIVTTDASPSYGFGVSVAKCTRATARLIGMASEDPNGFICLTRDPDDPPEKPCKGNCTRLRLRQRSFKTVLSVRAQHVEHSGGMEARGLALGLRWLSRSAHNHSKRVPMCVDATAVMGAAKKGRTSAHTLKCAIRRSAALALACDMQLYIAYIPSESNPSDWPSRGHQRRKVLNRYANRTVRAD